MFLPQPFPQDLASAPQPDLLPSRPSRARRLITAGAWHAPDVAETVRAGEIPPGSELTSESIADDAAMAPGAAGSGPGAAGAAVGPGAAMSGPGATQAAVGPGAAMPGPGATHAAVGPGARIGRLRPAVERRPFGPTISEPAVALRAGRPAALRGDR
ncbi:hypothetical protein AB0G04_41900 [Actinoplanes sp. NPDC023801]|uniref:hypothetical protein n=1 Tax=Actinoplanes sp. NPDC023801 TaxID=3154595 RepID=UPI0033BFCAD7